MLVFASRSSLVSLEFQYEMIHGLLTLFLIDNNIKLSAVSNNTVMYMTHTGQVDTVMYMTHTQLCDSTMYDKGQVDGGGFLAYCNGIIVSRFVHIIITHISSNNIFNVELCPLLFTYLSLKPTCLLNSLLNIAHLIGPCVKFYL